MTVFYGTHMTKIEAGTPPDPGFVHGTLRTTMESVTAAAQTTSDTIVVAQLPKGAILHGARIMASVTMGASATIAIGITGTTGKYRAAAVLTTADAWEELDVTSDNFHTALTAAEEVFITIAVASLPAAGTVLVQFTYTLD